MNINYFTLYKYSLLVICLMSMYAWFFWNLSIPVIVLATVSTSLIVFFNKEIFNNRAVLLIPLFILLIFEIYLIRDNEVTSFFSVILRTFILGSVIFLHKDIKSELLKFLTISISFILLISLIAWIGFLLGINLPHRYTEYQQGKYSYENYYWFLYNLNLQVFFLPRFSSIFPEPGNLAIITSFLILVNKFNFRKWYIWVLFIATLLSFSLAGYILITFAFLLYITYAYNNSFKKMILLICVVIAFVVFFKNYNDGQNPINLLIFERLKFENGNLAGYNRTTFIFDDYFKNFLASNELLCGIGAKQYTEIAGIFGGGTAGIKVFFVMHGIIGILLMFMLYIGLLIIFPSKLGLSMLITYFLCFYQNTYPLAEIVLITYILGLSNFYYSINDAKRKIKDSLHYC